MASLQPVIESCFDHPSGDVQLNVYGMTSTAIDAFRGQKLRTHQQALKTGRSAAQLLTVATQLKETCRRLQVRAWHVVRLLHSRLVGENFEPACPACLCLTGGALPAAAAAAPALEPCRGFERLQGISAGRLGGPFNRRLGASAAAAAYRRPRPFHDIN